MTIEKLIEEITDPNHYLRKSKNGDSKYLNNFSTAMSYLEELLNKKQFLDLLKNKLQMKNCEFDEKAFIQMACETTVVSYFAKNYKESFSYEIEVNPNNNKNIECQFKNGDYTYNIEVKCPNFGAKEAIENMSAFKVGTFGRVDGVDEMLDEIGEVIEEAQKLKGEEIKPLVKSKKMDNNLKDFLISASDKFNPNSTNQEVNVLFVCCGDAKDIQDWHYCLFAPKGLFTTGSFCDINNYKNVDVVVLTNLYHRHHKYFEKQHLDYNWLLDASFTLIFSNPFNSAKKEEAIRSFIKLFPHFNDELLAYEVPGNSPLELKQMLKIPWFVKEGLEERGIVLF